MSSQRGNVAKSRPPKHENKFAFKNNLHDTSHTIKLINSIEIHNVCAHCKGVLEWKIKYKKYKPLKAPSTCVKCHLKNVKNSYHTICTTCATDGKVCPKCGKTETLVPPTVASFDDSFLRKADVVDMIKSLSERRRRTFNRFVKKSVSDGVSDPENTIEELILAKLKEMNLDSGKLDDLSDDMDDDFDDDNSE